MKAAAAPVVALLLMVAAGGAPAQTLEKRQAGAVPPAPTQAPARPRVPPPTVSPVPPAHPSPPSTPSLAPSPFWAGPSTYAPHRMSPFHGRPRVPRRSGPFAPVYYGYGAVYSTGAPSPARDPSEPSGSQDDAGGGLYFDVEPGGAQVYVDGFYAGIVDDFDSRGVLLAAGRHWIELRASGYETLTIPVNISDGPPTRFRGKLIALNAPAPADVPPPAVGSPRAPETIYVIPGCYAGNRPPRASALARGCDIAGLRVRTY